MQILVKKYIITEEEMYRILYSIFNVNMGKKNSRNKKNKGNRGKSTEGSKSTAADGVKMPNTQNGENRGKSTEDSKSTAADGVKMPNTQNGENKKESFWKKIIWLVIGSIITLIVTGIYQIWKDQDKKIIINDITINEVSDNLILREGITIEKQLVKIDEDGNMKQGIPFNKTYELIMKEQGEINDIFLVVKDEFQEKGYKIQYISSSNIETKCINPLKREKEMKVKELQITLYNDEIGEKKDIKKDVYIAFGNGETHSIKMYLLQVAFDGTVRCVAVDDILDKNEGGVVSSKEMTEMEKDIKMHLEKYRSEISEVKRKINEENHLYY